MNGANIAIPSTWACMCQNLTWLGKTHAFMVWEGFKAQVCMSCLHNIYDRPRFHQRSSCSLIFIILHSPPMPLSTDIAHWVVNGANVQIPLTCACMHQNLTWLDKTCAFTVWEGFKAQGCMLCPHNHWDCPRFHQLSSCSLIVIIHHSHQGNLCPNYLEISWNVFQQAHRQCHYPPTSHVRQWVGPTLKFLQLVHVWVKIWHG